MSMNNKVFEGDLPLQLASLILVNIVSSFGEEVICRGFLIARLSAIFGGRGCGGC